MKKLEYIESKLEKLTPEFKNSKIIDEDNKETTFENYLKGYVFDNMRDDFTFGNDEIVNNIDTLIMIQASTSKIDPYEKIELPKMNKERIVESIYAYINEKGYQKYLDCYMDYNDELFGTLQMMIEDFMIPNIDEYGNIKEFGHTYSFKDFIDLKVTNYINSFLRDESALKTEKKHNLEEKYKEFLNYPINDIDNSLTTFGLYIDRLINLMDSNGNVNIMGKSYRIESFLETEIDKCIEMYESFLNSCQDISISGAGLLDDFKRIAVMTNAEVPSGTIIDKLLNSILRNIMSKLSNEQINELRDEIIQMDIRNEGILNRSLNILNNTNISESKSELETSEDISILTKKDGLRTYVEQYTDIRDFTVESAKKIYNDFCILLDDFIACLGNRELSDDNHRFLLEMEEYRTSMKTRYIFEDEKVLITSSYKKLKRQMEDDTDIKLNDYLFAFNSIKAKIEDLKEMSRNIIHISKKDEILFETMINTSTLIKKQIVEQENSQRKEILS